MRESKWILRRVTVEIACSGLLDKEKASLDAVVDEGF
jgi:hypothetical protein